jgi:hypothetical protein
MVDLTDVIISIEKERNEAINETERDFYSGFLKVLKKDVPRAPVHEYGRNYSCDRCGNMVVRGMNYCEECGQRLEWNKK